ncbi:uncharacterized protein VNE69_05230 [Vairimorpha necatrix]|uniref:Uncharacterized protein n=1 Tax=Vairimorpha necatrix TaxID=6039 RepID=A0AAX4JCG9_9MICR
MCTELFQENSLSKSEILLRMDEVRLGLLNNTNKHDDLRDLKNFIIIVKDYECFDKFVELYLNFKENKEFLKILLECKEVYFERFFKYLQDLDINKNEWDLFK